MPTIKPVDIQDCVKFINQNREEIISGIYDIEIEGLWVNKIDNAELVFIAKHCVSSKEIIAETATAPNVLEFLAESCIEGVKRGVAKNPNTPLGCLGFLAKDCSDELVLIAIAERKDLMPSIWLELAGKKIGVVEVAVASNANAPISILINLAKNSNSSVREAVAENGNTPGDVLEVLARDSYWRVRRSVAKNRNAPNNILRVLARDSEYWVRNKNTPSDILEVLGEASYSVVLGNPNCPVKFLEEEEKKKRGAMRTKQIGEIRSIIGWAPIAIGFVFVFVTVVGFSNFGTKAIPIVVISFIVFWVSCLIGRLFGTV